MKYFPSSGSYACFLLLFFVSQLAVGQAQNKSIIKGKVLDERSDEPIEYAVSYLKANNHVGDVTDRQGNFEIAYPSNFSADSLIIYLLGYESKTMALRDIDAQQDTVIFRLQRKSFLLDDIIVEEKGYPVRDIYFKALKQIPKNYPTGKHQLKGFYRRLSTEEDQYTQLQEAAITIDDVNYARPIDDFKVSVEAFRQTEDWGNTDSLAIHMFTKYRESFSEGIGTPANDLHRLYYSGYIRHYKLSGTHFNYKSRKEHIDNLLIELMDVRIQDGDTLYKIAYGNSQFQEKPSGNNYVVINSTDHAIVEFQIVHERYDEYFRNLVHAKYQKIEGRYYPKFIKKIVPRHINREVDDNELNIDTFWFDEVKTKDFKKIKYKNAIDKFDIDDHHAVKYDPDYWRQSPLPTKYPLSESEKSGLEIHGPLEEQFNIKSDDQKVP